MLMHQYQHVCLTGEKGGIGGGKGGGREGGRGGKGLLGGEGNII